MNQSISRYNKDQSAKKTRDRERDAMIQRIVAVELAIRDISVKMSELNRVISTMSQREKRKNG